MWDLGIVVLTGTTSSVSQTITDATRASPIQCFGAGVLCCHFFGWMMQPQIKG